MPVDAKEALTRKLGPLPAWGWGVAIGGAILVAKLIRGGSSPTPNAGYTPTVAGGGGMVGTGGDATPTDVFSGANSLVEQLQEQVEGQSDTLTALTEKITGQETTITNQQGLISGLTDTVQTLTDFQGLQTKLIDLLKQRDSINASIASNQTLLAKHQAMLKACETTSCRTTQNSYIDKYRKQLDAARAKLAPIDTQITATQKQLNEANQS